MLGRELARLKASGMNVLVRPKAKAKAITRPKPVMRLKVVSTDMVKVALAMDWDSLLGFWLNKAPSRQIFFKSITSKNQKVLLIFAFQTFFSPPKTNHLCVETNGTGI